MYINTDPPALMSLQCTLRTIHLRMNSQDNRRDAVERLQYEAHDTSLKDSYSIHNLVLMVHKISVYIFLFFPFFTPFLYSYLAACFYYDPFFYKIYYLFCSFFLFITHLNLSLSLDMYNNLCFLFTQHQRQQTNSILDSRIIIFFLHLMKHLSTPFTILYLFLLIFHKFFCVCV